MDWYQIVALVAAMAAIVMVFAEFLLPTGGFFVVIAIILSLIGVVLTFVYGTIYEGVAATALVCVGMPTAIYLMFMVWKNMSNVPGVNSESAMATIHELPEIAQMDRLKGKIGKTLTPMRPAGSVEIEGRRVDAVTEGMMIDADRWVKCVNVKSGWVVVREVEEPSELSDFRLDDLT